MAPLERQTDAAGKSAPALTTVGLLTHVLVPLNLTKGVLILTCKAILRRKLYLY